MLIAHRLRLTTVHDLANLSPKVLPPNLAGIQDASAFSTSSHRTTSCHVMKSIPIPADPTLFRLSCSLLDTIHRLFALKPMSEFLRLGFFFLQARLLDVHPDALSLYQDTLVTAGMVFLPNISQREFFPIYLFVSTTRYTHCLHTHAYLSFEHTLSAVPRLKSLILGANRERERASSKDTTASVFV